MWSQGHDHPSPRALRVIPPGSVRVFCLALPSNIGVLINLEEGRGRPRVSRGEQLAWPKLPRGKFGNVHEVYFEHASPLTLHSISKSFSEGKLERVQKMTSSSARYYLQYCKFRNHLNQAPEHREGHHGRTCARKYCESWRTEPGAERGRVTLSP